MTSIGAGGEQEQMKLQEVRNCHAGILCLKPEQQDVAMINAIKNY